MLYLTTERPKAIVRQVREEDIPGVMHQFCEPHYGAVAEGAPGPFTWAVDQMLVYARAARAGFKPFLVC